MGGNGAGQAQRTAAVVGFVLAVIVLVAGVAAALTKDDDTTSQRTSVGASTSSTTSSSSSHSSSSSAATTATTASSTASASTTTLGTLPGSGSTSLTTVVLPPTSTTTTTVPLSADAAERTANALFGAYRVGDQATASRYATADVVNALFSRPFHEASDQGCTADGELFRCRIASAVATYDFTVQSNPSNGDPIVVIFGYQGPA